MRGTVEVQVCPGGMERRVWRSRNMSCLGHVPTPTKVEPSLPDRVGKLGPRRD